MNLFIDTNVLLSFYHLTSEDLEELHKLVVLLENGNIRLWLPEQIKDEFSRNRENKLADALKKLKDQKSKAQFPAFCKDYPEYEELRAIHTEAEKKFSELLTKVNGDIAAKQLTADAVISQLFTKAEFLETTSELIDIARSRVDIGNPPGKRGALGDAINWETLLAEVPDEEDIHFVAGDSDYYSLLDGESMKDFLVVEWESRKQSRIFVYRRLSQYFKEHYPEIGLASELEKQEKIFSLVHSASFAETHLALAKLSGVNEFSSDEVAQMVEAFFANNQIYWIVGDRDVHAFYSKLVQEYGDEIDQEHLPQLVNALESTEPEEL